VNTLLLYTSLPFKKFSLRHCPDWLPNKQIHLSIPDSVTSVILDLNELDLLYFSAPTGKYFASKGWSVERHPNIMKVPTSIFARIDALVLVPDKVERLERAGNYKKGWITYSDSS
jgi:hypothetical protein